MSTANPVKRTISPDSPIYATFALNAGGLLIGGLCYLFFAKDSLFSVEDTYSEEERKAANAGTPRATT